ncbi:MAG: DNA topoisomerase IV subunit A, partial [Verrucomicrobia bacterium]|nr:DNA topoisomerase IV subunit A [Verrucomicrobiota bacterium]
EKCKVLFIATGTPETLYIRYKPAPHQKINQQTCNPSEVEVKGARTRGRQLTIKDVGAVDIKPPRGWDPEATITKVMFA